MAHSNLEIQKLNAQIQAICEALKGLVSRLDEIERSFKEMPPDVKAKEALDPEELERLPWRAYREGHRSGWIFADTKGAEQLREILKEAKRPIRVGEFSYRLSKGQNREFISRNPIKNEEKRRVEGSIRGSER